MTTTPTSTGTPGPVGGDTAPDDDTDAAFADATGADDVPAALVPVDDEPEADGATGTVPPVRADEPVVQADAAPVSPVGIRGISGDPARVPGVAAGRLRVQDEGSQLAALALSRSSDVRAGERWLDMCAGPGGKAARRTTACLAATATPPASAMNADTCAVRESEGRNGGGGEVLKFARTLSAGWPS